LPETFSRTIDRAKENAKNYTLRDKDVTEGGRGLSTIGDKVDPKTVLAETGEKRLVRIPRDDVPEGLEWMKTQGNYGKRVLDENHWELWHPQKYNRLTRDEYVSWWNESIAPDLAQRALEWMLVK
jgi:hypothetical protein